MNRSTGKRSCLRYFCGDVDRAAAAAAPAALGTVRVAAGEIKRNIIIRIFMFKRGWSSDKDIVIAFN